MSLLAGTGQNIRSRISDYWQTLSPREQIIVSIAGGMIALLLFYSALIRPVQDYHSQAESRLNNSERTYTDVMEKAEKITALLASGAKISSGEFGQDEPLDILISRSARKFGIVLKGINQQNRSLVIKLAPIDFSRLTRWLVYLDEQNVRAITLQMSRTKNSGIVEVQQLRLQLKTAPGSQG